MTNDSKHISYTQSIFSSPTYTMHEKIGEGGFGQVFKATNKVTQQTVAIKTLSLNPELSDEKRQRYIERFERETFLGSRLQHPNIVRLLDKGQSGNDLVYAVFEFIEGESIRERLQASGPLTPVETMEVMSQVLDALVHAHAQGVIHRDLKPANIMLTNVGAKLHAKILDFGIGTLTHEARQIDFKSITLTRETLGTPSYSAPEQLRGEPPTPKTDLYVWGLVFIECLTGRPTISGANLAAIFQKQLNPENVPLPPALIGHPIADLLRRVLDKKVNSRVESANEVYGLLQRLNLSSLVGNIDQAPSRAGVAHSNDNNNTTIISDRYVSTAWLTEQKHMTVMSITLNMHASALNRNNHDVVDTLLQDQKLQCVDIAVRYGAMHVGTLGNTMLFYFGFPTTSDNDCRLCARAALEVISRFNKQNALRKYSQNIETKACIGIHTGVMTIYPDMVPEGETANTAMTLSNSAKPNQIVCSESIYRKLDGHVEFELIIDSEPTNGLESASLYSMMGERLDEAYGFLRANHRYQSFIGRQHELDSLEGLLSKGQSAIAHVYGEAGIGKSRLVYEVKKKASDYVSYVAQCLPEYKNSALYPIISLIEYKFSLVALDARSAVAQLQNVLMAQDRLALSSSLQVACAWLGLPMPDSINTVVLSPNEWKHVLFDTITYLLCYEYQREEGIKHLFLIEDLHWVDPTSIEFIAHIMDDEHFKQSSHVFISTSREALPTLLSQKDILSLEINKLSDAASEEYISHLFEKERVASRVAEAITSRSDGVPLFIEELVSIIRQKEDVHFINGKIDFVNDNQIDMMPNNLLELFQEKLDSLGFVKQTAQLAATIGREFGHALLVIVLNKNEEDIQADLDALIQAEIVYLVRRVEGDHYVFKHALVREAAYETLVSDSKVTAHCSIATALEMHFPEVRSSDPIRLANHFAHGNLFTKATHYGIKAAQKQLSNSTNIEVIDIANKSIAWAKKIPETLMGLEVELELRGMMLSAEMSLSGYGAKKVAELKEQISALVSTLNEMDGDTDNALRQALLSKGEWAHFLQLHYGAQRAEARALGEHILATARASNDRQKLMAILVMLSQAKVFDGDIDEGLAGFDEILSLYDDETDKNIWVAYGTDPKAQALSISSSAYLTLGYVDKAYEKIEQAISYSEKIGHDSSIVFAYIFKAFWGYFTGNKNIIIETAELYERKHGSKKDTVWHGIFLKLLHNSTLGNVEQAKELLQAMLDSGQDFAVAWYVPSIVDEQLTLGQTEEATSLLEDTLSRLVRARIPLGLHFTKYHLARCYYITDQGLTPRVEALLLDGMSDAQHQKAKYFELEILFFYSQRCEEAKRDELLVQLERLLSWFEEGKKTSLYINASRFLLEQTQG